MIEIGPRLLYAVLIAASAFIIDSLLKFTASTTPYHEIHEERITERESTHVS